MIILHNVVNFAFHKVLSHAIIISTEDQIVSESCESVALCLEHKAGFINNCFLFNVGHFSCKIITIAVFLPTKTNYFLGFCV